MKQKIGLYKHNQHMKDYTNCNKRDNKIYWRLENNRMKMNKQSFNNNKNL